MARTKFYQKNIHCTKYKLMVNPNGQVDNVNREYDIIEQNEHVQIETDSDSDSEIDDNDHNNNDHRNERYNLRRHVNMPERYGVYAKFTHYAKSLF